MAATKRKCCCSVCSAVAGTTQAVVTVSGNTACGGFGPYDGTYTLTTKINNAFFCGYAQSFVIGGVTHGFEILYTKPSGPWQIYLAQTTLATAFFSQTYSGGLPIGTLTNSLTSCTGSLRGYGGTATITLS